MIEQMNKEQFIEAIKPYLKDNGFKKVKTTWYKIMDDTIFVFNVQGSQWGPEYYINYGIYIRALGPELNPSMISCHIGSGINQENKTVLHVIEDAMLWFNKHSSIALLKALYNQDNLPLPTTLKAKEFLKNIEL